MEFILGVTQEGITAVSINEIVVIVVQRERRSLVKQEIVGLLTSARNGGVDYSSKLRYGDYFVS